MKKILLLGLLLAASANSQSQVTYERLLGASREPRLKFLRQISLIPPDGPSRARIDCKSAVILTGSIQDAIHDEGRGFKLAEIAHLKSPLHCQTRGAAGIDLIERAVAPAGIAAGIGEPVLGFA